MNEFFKKTADRLKNFWQQWKAWSLVKKLILLAIVLVLGVVIVLIATLSSSSDEVTLFSKPETDTEILDRISARLDKESIAHKITADGKVLLKDERTARRARSLLFRENLIPKDVSPWDVFNTGSKWTVTELQDKVKVQQAVTRTLEQHIKSLDEVDDAQVILTFPEKTILASTQNPVKASVIVTPKPGVNLHEQNRIRGIEQLVLFAVDGLEKENLTITDFKGNVLNSDDALIAQMNEFEIGKKELKFKLELQNRYAEQILKNLQTAYPNRVVIANLELNVNFDKESYEENVILPTVLKEDNPKTPKDESSIIDKVDVVTEKKRVTYAGTGVHPDGPAGVEGQVPDGFKENVGAIVETDEQHDIVKSEISKRISKGEKSPIKIEKFAVGILVDGKWTVKKDKKGRPLESENGGIVREFVQISDQEIKTIEEVVKSSVASISGTNDGVTVKVTGIQFDRSQEHEDEDARYRKRKQVNLGLIIGFAALLFFILLVVMTQFIIRAREQKRKREDQERARQLALQRQAALEQAENESKGILTVGSKNAEEEEMMRQMVRENPENVAHLIRTWLVEE